MNLKRLSFATLATLALAAPAALAQQSATYRVHGPVCQGDFCTAVVVNAEGFGVAVRKLRGEGVEARTRAEAEANAAEFNRGENLPTLRICTVQAPVCRSVGL